MHDAPVGYVNDVSWYNLNVLEHCLLFGLYLYVKQMPAGTAFVYINLYHISIRASHQKFRP